MSSLLHRPFALAGAVGLLLSAGVARADIIGVTHGRIGVVQNDAGNNSTSVTLTRDGGSQSFGVLGGNRGDFDVTFGTPNDVDSGVMITSVRNNGRDNSAGGGPGLSYGTTAASELASRERYFIPTFASSGGAEVSGDEFNLDVAAGHFRFDTHLGGVAENSANGGAITSLRGSTGINLGTQFIDNGNGQFGVDLTSLGASSANGILLAVGAKNEDNYASTRAESDGTFSLFNKDNGANGASYEQDPVGFVYLADDLNVVSGGAITLGRVLGNAVAEVASGLFNVANIGTGQYFLEIVGQTSQTGTLLLTGGGGDPFNRDNIFSYEAFVNNGVDGFLIETRDLPGVGLQTIPGDEEAFSFVFVADAAPAAVPEPGTTALLGLAAVGACGGVLRRRRAAATA